jgi:hypothetical protein
MACSLGMNRMEELELYELNISLDLANNCSTMDNTFDNNRSGALETNKAIEDTSYPQGTFSSYQIGLKMV